LVQPILYPLDLERPVSDWARSLVVQIKLRRDEIRIELVYGTGPNGLRIQRRWAGFDVENQAMRNGFGLLG